MKKLLVLLLGSILLAGAVNSCLKYDDAAIKHELELLDGRVSDLEKAVTDINNEILSIQSFINGTVFMYKFSEEADGFHVTLSDGRVFVIKNGVDGQDGVTPVIGVRQDNDGEWYWTVNGEWLLGSDMNKMRVVGKDGKDGNNAIAPKLKIEDGWWYMSTDGGISWTKMSKATGEDGKDGDTLFRSVDYDDSFVYLTLVDGTVLKVSRGASQVQAVSVIPDYVDGSVEAKAGEFTMRFIVAPLSAAQSISVLADSFFSVRAVYTQTKASAGELVTLPIVKKSVSGDILSVTADGSVLGEVFGGISYGASASLTIDDGFTAVTSGFFPLYDDYGKKHGHSYVDLGLSVLWATCNVGAGSPEESGALFAWGETSVKSAYNWDNYLWGNPPTKYKDDGRDQLELTDDAAHVNWGGSWRMPTKAEIDELCNEDNCAWSWTTQNGVNGYRVVSKKGAFSGNSIFLPAAGRQWNASSPSDVNAIGSYWSATANLGYTNDAFIIYIVSQNYQKVTSHTRGAGLSVRPVCSK